MLFIGKPMGRSIMISNHTQVVRSNKVARKRQYRYMYVFCFPNQFFQKIGLLFRGSLSSDSAGLQEIALPYVLLCFCLVLIRGNPSLFAGISMIRSVNPGNPSEMEFLYQEKEFVAGRVSGNKRPKVAPKLAQCASL